MSKIPVQSATPGPWSFTTERIVAAGVLVGITIIMGVVPVLGFIPVPNVTANATIEHIPTILGSVLEGPVVGMVTGFFFGLMSFLRSPIPLFKDPLVAFIPRILIGLTSWLVFAGLRRFSLDVAAFAAGLVGAATNTVFVLTFGIWRQDAPFAGIPTPVIIAAVLPQAIAEAIIAAIIAVIITRAMYIVRGRYVRATDRKSREDLPY
ncbi:MAG: ECF transporter S component [Ktedonobacteraceae bacterium]